MPLLTRRAFRYLRAWFGAPASLTEVEIEVERADATVPATLVHPPHARGPLPSWVVLHGMTRAGRHHEQLGRFTRTLASTGAVVLVPDVPRWRELRLAPEEAAPTVRGAVAALRAGGWCGPEGAAVIGFSFGAPHGIATAGELRDDVLGAVGFGGYADIESTFRFMMTGATRRGEPTGGDPPDPYGRWIVGANYLTAVPGFEDHGEAERALHDLAIHSGDVGLPSWDSVYDPVIERLRAEIPPAQRSAFDLFATARGALPPREPAEELAEALARAAREIDPLLDPTERLARVTRPVHIMHGRSDRLISWREADKLARALPDETVAGVTVTRLFAHSSQEPFSLLHAVAEAPAFVRALGGLLSVP